MTEDHGGKRHDDTSYGKRFDDQTFKQIFRAWPTIASIITACWVLYTVLNGKFMAIEGRLNSQDVRAAVMDDKISNIQDNVKILLKRQ